MELDLMGQSIFVKDLYLIKALRGEYVNVSAKIKSTFLKWHGASMMRFAHLSQPNKQNINLNS